LSATNQLAGPPAEALNFADLHQRSDLYISPQRSKLPPRLEKQIGPTYVGIGSR
jgi:hypothetical protein